MREKKRLCYNDRMEYLWDEQKNEINVEKHGIDFADAHQVFQMPLLTKLDDRFDYGEDRWVGLGLLNNRVVNIVYREPGEEIRRIISLRKALPHERKYYEQFLRNQGRGSFAN